MRDGDVLIAAGLLARKAVERGLVVPPFVKTSLAPGSLVVSRYLERAGLQTYLDRLGFGVVGYGCATCIGNSGPIDEQLLREVDDNEVVACAVLSGNRNFEARIHPAVRAAFLASPPLVIVYALAGTMDIVSPGMQSGTVVTGYRCTCATCGRPTRRSLLHWNKLRGPRTTNRLTTSTSLPPIRFGRRCPHRQASATPGQCNRHICASRRISPTRACSSPAFASGPAHAHWRSWGTPSPPTTSAPIGAIKAESPAGRYLREAGVEPRDFNSYGARRMNHEVMVRGAFANVRLANQMVPGVEGGVTAHQPSGERMTVYDAAMRYAREGVPLVLFAGEEYGIGSARDWAAKGTRLLGVRAVIARSFERIHRSNLAGMGVLPSQFQADTSLGSLGLDGTEAFELMGLGEDARPRQPLTLIVRRRDGSSLSVPLTLRLDTQAEVEYARRGGILPYVVEALG